MTASADNGDPPLSPDDAFAVLGNETRMEILQVLSDSLDPLPFSELRDRVGVRDSGQFNYHLGKLVGHFVRQTDDGYQLSEPGRRVIEAVLSGAVTEVPDPEPTQLDMPCPYCGASVRVTYETTSPRPVQVSCTECAGAAEWIDPFEPGQIGTLRFSPAGLEGRSPSELLQAAVTREHLELLAALHNVCPRCTATIEHSLDICESHDSSDGLCEECNRRYVARLSSRCRNCLFRPEAGNAVSLALGTVDMLAFLANHGINPLTDPWGTVLHGAEEEVLSTDPFKVRYTFTIDDDSLTVTVDDALNVDTISP